MKVLELEMINVQPSSKLDQWLLVLILFSTTLLVECLREDIEIYPLDYYKSEPFSEEGHKKYEVPSEIKTTYDSFQSPKLNFYADYTNKMNPIPETQFRIAWRGRFSRSLYAKRRDGEPIFGKKDLFEPYPRFDSRTEPTRTSLTTSKPDLFQPEAQWDPDRTYMEPPKKVIKMAKRSVVIQVLANQTDDLTIQKYVPVPHRLPKYGGNQIKGGSRMASSRDVTLSNTASSNTTLDGISITSTSRAAAIGQTTPVLTRTATLCKTHMVAEGEMLLLYADYQPYRYTCQQVFLPVLTTSLVTLSCPTLALRLGCAFERLVLTTDNTSTTLCRNDPAPVLTGPRIGLSFRRSVSGLNGGYFCMVAGVAIPPRPQDPGPGSCPSCGVTKFTVKDVMVTTGNSSVLAAVAKSALAASSRTVGEAAAGITSKIVGGTTAQQEAHPWQALVRIHAGVETYFCGGTLITTRLVLSAAHCLYGLAISNVEINLGVLDRTKTETGSVHFDTKSFNIHEAYNSTTFLNDISVIHLLTPVTFSTRIRPACLPIPGRDINNKDVVATGWGLTAWDGTLSTQLQEVTLNVWPNLKCEQAWQNYFKDISFHVPDSQACALNPGKDTCSGDSGGPLVMQVGGHSEVAGITSFGYECATPNLPGVYTRVSAFLPWIQKFIEAADCGA